MRADKIWQSSTLVESFLTGVRGGIPFAKEQINIALRLLDQVWHSTRGGMQPVRVADLGCGDGVIAQAVLTHYPQVQVTAIDFSEPMLHQAQQRLQGFAGRVEFIHSDLYDATWCEGLAAFDAVLSGYCIHHLPDPRKQALYQEIFQLLTPGGCFLNIEHVKSASPWVESLFYGVLVDSLYQWQQSQGGELSRQEVGDRFVYREDRNANILAPVETQCEWLREIGFREVDCYFKFFELAVFGGVRPLDSN